MAVTDDDPSHPPKVSVVLVAYNRAASLPATLDSLLAQRFRDFELIVSDDCSTDGTAEVGAAYAARDPRVRYRRNAENLRMPGNLNAAIAEARGEYVAIAHDSDLYRDDLLERWAGALDRHPNAAFVFNAYGFRNSDRVDVHPIPECMDGRTFLRETFVPNWGGCPVFGQTMIRRRCLDEVGLFDPTYSMNSDIEMWVRLASRWDVAYIPEPLLTISPREKDHFLKGHYWWERTVDVRVKRMAHEIVYGKAFWPRLRFELMARRTYLCQTLAVLKNRRWADAWQGLGILLTGRDDVAPPY